MRDLSSFESPTTAKAFDLWQNHMHPFTCGGGGGPCSGVDLELLAANPHAFLLTCPKCGRQQLEAGPKSLFSLVAGHAERHNPADCFICQMRSRRTNEETNG